MEYFVNPEIYFVLFSEGGAMTIILMIIVYYFQKIKSCLAEFKKLIPVLSFKEKGNVMFPGCRQCSFLQLFLVICCKIWLFSVK